MGIAEFALNLVVELLGGAIHSGVSYAGLSFFARRKIERRVEDATAEVIEPLIPFLSIEGISEDKQYRLIQTCVDELRPFTQQPELLFQGSLNGQKIFDTLYSSRELPQVIIEDGVKDIYTLLCPRIATLLCTIPLAVKNWESEAWSENFRRFDEITAQLRTLFGRVDALATQPSKEADETLSIVRRALAQKIAFELELTGLRADRPLAGKFDDLFVHPEIKKVPKTEHEKPIVVGLADESFNRFTYGSRSVIVGGSGAGKSTWSKWLQREILSVRWSGIGLRIELRHLDIENLPSLHELTRESIGKHYAEDLTTDRINRWLKSKQIVFILDGFDEIRPEDRDIVYDWVVDLGEASRQCPIILTSRPLTTDHIERLRATWQYWVVEPFDTPRVIDYIQRWHCSTPLLLDNDREVDAEKLASAWKADPTIGPLTGNPLLLSTLLMVHHLDGSLPSGRSQLYRRYVEGMLGLWDDRRRVTASTVELTIEQKRQILRGFAVHLFLLQKDELDEGVTTVWLTAQLEKMKISPTCEAVLAALRERSGLIVGPGIYNFAHKSIAEYLVAETILQGDIRYESEHRLDRLLLFKHRDEDRWNSVTFLWAGLAPMTDVESFIEACFSAKSWDLAYGILADQYERIPIDIRRRLMLRIFQEKEWPGEKDTNHYWVVSRPKTLKHPLEIPTLHLRGITPGHNFANLVFKAVGDGTLIWTDINGTHGNLRDILWMAFTIKAKTVEDWKTCLDSPCPSTSSPELWYLWTTESKTFRILTGTLEHSLDVVIQSYKQCRPEFTGVMPIALMSAMVMSIMRQDDKDVQPYEIDQNKLLALIEALPNSGDGQISPDLLEGTRDWLLGWARQPDENIGDLLSCFKNQMDQLLNQGLVEKNKAYEAAISFVEDLIQKRSALSSSA